MAQAAPGTVIRVAIADDQMLVRAGFAALLAAEDDMEVAGEAAGGEALLSPTVTRRLISEFAARTARDRAQLVVFAYQAGLAKALSSGHGGGRRRPPRRPQTRVLTAVRCHGSELDGHADLVVDLAGGRR